jgi:hypothetical protein
MNDRASVARWLSVVKTYEKSYWALLFLLRSAHRPRRIWDKTAGIERPDAPQTHPAGADTTRQASGDSLRPRVT